MFTIKGEMGIMTIKEAAKKLHVEAHVLRYWEDELKLDIKRNAQGHRYYDDRDIRLFESVKDEGRGTDAQGYPKCDHSCKTCKI